MATKKLDFSKPHVLRDDAEYDTAVKEMDDLLDRDPSPGTEDYDRLEFLTVLVAAYDAEQVRFGDDPVSPAAVVDFVLEQRGMTRAELAPLMGGKSRVSEFFSGTRRLSMTQLQNLHTQLGIPAALLLPTGTQTGRPKATAFPRTGAERRARTATTFRPFFMGADKTVSTYETASGSKAASAFKTSRVTKHKTVHATGKLAAKSGRPARKK